MTTKEFIEKAIEGGWNKFNYLDNPKSEVFYDKFGKFGGIRLGNHQDTLTLEEIVLDTKAWEAVGKAEGWGEGVIAFWRSEKAKMTPPEFFMHNMVEYLFEGGTIETYLATL